MSNPTEPVTNDEYSALPNDNAGESLDTDHYAITLGTSSYLSYHNQRTKEQCPLYLFILLELFFSLVGLALIGQAMLIPKIITKYFRNQVHDRFLITKQMQESNSTEYQHWISNNFSTSGKQIFRYYIFNVTNPIAVMQGYAPTIEECGPYVYRRFEFRKKVQFSNDSSSVSYDYEYSYEQYPELMPPGVSYSDIVWFINPVILMFANSYVENPATKKQKDFNHEIDLTLQGFAKSRYRWLVNRSANSLLLEGSKPTVDWKFIDLKPVSIIEDTGATNSMNVGNLQEYGSPMIDWWASTEWVNVSREFRVFPDNDWVTSQPRLTVWAFDKFRKVDYVFDSTTTLHGLELFKYKIDPAVYLNSKHNPHNAKYFQFGPDGLLNLTAKPTNWPGCRAPTFSSKGLFLDSPFYLDTVAKPFNLRQPNANMDETFFEVDPKSGVVFHTHGGTMISFHWKPTPPKVAHGAYSKLFNGLVPFVNTVGDAGATQQDIQDYLAVLDKVEMWEQASLYAGPSLGAAVLIVALWACCRRRHVARKNAEKKVSSLIGSASLVFEKKIEDLERKCPESYGSAS